MPNVSFSCKQSITDRLHIPFGLLLHFLAGISGYVLTCNAAANWLAIAMFLLKLTP